MNVSYDYTDRLVDLELLPHVSYPQGVMNVGLSLTDTDGVSRFTTGLEKLIQRYAVLFLTALGSNAADINSGSEFATAVIKQQMVTRGQIVHFFALANTRVLQQLSAENASITLGIITPDEQIADAELLGYEIQTNSATVRLRIKLTNQAGDATTFVVPVSRL